MDQILALRFCREDVEEHGEIVEGAPGQNKKMPDGVIKREFLPGEKQDAARVGQPPREQQQETAAVDGQP